MPNWKKEKKSRSVNDIPVAKNHNTLIHSLDDGDFRELLCSVARPSYNSDSSDFVSSFKDGRVGATSSTRETSALVKVCEKGLRDEDAAKEEEKRRQQDRRAGNRDSYERLNSFSRSPSPPVRRIHQVQPSHISKPVDFDTMNIDYIDENDGNDVEMVDLSGSMPNRRFIRGNHVDTVHEWESHVDSFEDVEMGLVDDQGLYPTQRTMENRVGHRYDFSGGNSLATYINHSVNAHRWPTNPNENFLKTGPHGSVFRQEHTILGPQSGGMFCSLNNNASIHDYRPELTPTYASLPEDEEYLMAEPYENVRAWHDPIGSDMSPPLEREGSASPLDEVVHDDNLLNMNGNNFKGPNEDKVPALNSKLDNKRNKKKNKKDADTKLAKDIPGCMGEKPIEALLEIIEGPLAPVISKKQQKPNQQVGSVDAEGSKKENRRRKSKDGQKESEGSAAAAVTNAVTIGNQQQKAAAGAAIASQVAHPAIVDVKQKDPKNNNKSPKRKSGGASSSPTVPQIGRKSTEDGDEEFLSADEGINIKPPTNHKNTSVAKASDVMLDGANYRADDDDLTVIGNESKEESEFITVGGKTKKKTPVQTTRTGSAGKTERKLKDKASEPRRSSMEDKVSATPSTPTQKSPRRPNNTSLADFIDDKKTDSKLNKTPTRSAKKTLRQERPESTADSEHNYHDAVGESDEMAAIARTASTASPDRAFSYADAAKKSADQSRESSPINTLQQPQSTTDVPSPAETPVSVPTLEKTNIIGVSGAELPGGKSATASTGGLSFFYDENEKSSESPPDAAVSMSQSADGGVLLNVGGKTVHFQGVAPRPVSAIHTEQVKILQKQFDDFCNIGSVPVKYIPNSSN